MAEPTPAANPPASPTSPLLGLVQRAIKAHPVLRDEKKLQIKSVGPIVRLEGSVFTRDALRQLLDLVARLPGNENVRLDVATDVKPPQPRAIVGRVPVASEGPPSTDAVYSIRSVRPPRK